MFLVMKKFPLVMMILLQVMMMNIFLMNFEKNPNAMIKGLMKQVRVRDELFEEQEKFLVQERKINDELKKLLALKKGKVEKLDQELAQSKKATSSLKSSIDAL
jgi:hypothetical protein